jgi:hypothetical protein
MNMPQRGGKFANLPVKLITGKFSNLPPLWRGVAVFAAAVVAVLGVDRAAPRAVSGDAPLKKMYFGNQACGSCHANETTPAMMKTDFTRGTEMHIWSKFDKHKDATLVLKGPLGQQMAQRLGIKGDIAQEKQCVSCHGVLTGPGDALHDSFKDAAAREASGVSCVVCHGPYPAWVEEHVKIFGAWESLTRADKETKHGLTDLWDPRKRAELCCSCHVGDHRQGKVVTHEMYAAGHPPLPGIEVAAFSDAMPRHWETWSEKLARQRKKLGDADFAKKQKLYEHAFMSKFEADDAEQTRLVAVSAVVALRASARLAQDHAQAEMKQPGTWPELANYDCYACHHELKHNNWRQQRSTAGRPGRPPMRPWPTALVPLSVADDSAVAASFSKSVRDLQTAFTSTPFGAPADVAKHAGSAVHASDNLLKALESRTFKRDDAATLLQRLVAEAAKEPVDFDSARQVGWAAHSLLADMQKLDRPDLQQPLSDLRRLLALELPKGQTTVAGPFLREVYTRIADYEPAGFQKTIQTVGATAR